MRVLVTGGAGYIGSHTCKALAAAGHEPITFDNLSVGHRWAVRWGPFVEGDLADGAHLRRVITGYDVAAVVHFAASAYVGESVEHPRRYYGNNVVNTLNLLDAMHDTDVSHIVLSSTCAVYGVPIALPLRPPYVSDQPIWRHETGNGAGAPLVRPGLRVAMDGSPLLQHPRALTRMETSGRHMIRRLT